MLPGDYIAYKLSGDITTTAQGLSEGILWDFKQGEVSESVLSHYGLSKELLASQVPCFGIQAELNGEAANVLGMKKGTPITYRSGDQPNNAQRA
jgi:xylulokinase